YTGTYEREYTTNATRRKTCRAEERTRLRVSSSGLPGRFTTMLRSPWVVISASETPVESTRCRMMDTACSSCSLLMSVSSDTCGSRMIDVPPSRSSASFGDVVASEKTTPAAMIPPSTRVTIVSHRKRRPGRGFSSISDTFQLSIGSRMRGGSVLLVGIRVGGVGIRIGIGGVLGPIRLRVLVVGRRRGIGLITCVLDDSIGLVACILGDAVGLVADVGGLGVRVLFGALARVHRIELGIGDRRLHVIGLRSGCIGIGGGSVGDGSVDRGGGLGVLDLADGLTVDAQHGPGTRLDGHLVVLLIDRENGSEDAEGRHHGRAGHEPRFDLLRTHFLLTPRIEQEKDQQRSKRKGDQQIHRYQPFI